MVTLVNRVRQLRWQTRAFYSQFGALPTFLGLFAEFCYAAGVNRLTRFRFQAHDSRVLGRRTAGRIEQGDLDLEPDLAANAIAYEPTPAYQFYAVLRELGSSWAAYSFVDYGCGMGRVLALAADHGFGRVVGVEASERLAAEAELFSREGRESNSPPRFTVICADAAQVSPPGLPWVVFMFNPFNEQVMGPVIRKLEGSEGSSSGSPSYLLYKNPSHAELFDQSPYFERISEPMGGGWIIYRFSKPSD